MADETQECGHYQTDQLDPPHPPRIAGDSISIEIGDGTHTVAAGKNIIHAVVKLGPGQRFRINLDYCKGCGICAAECPCGAIEMVPEQI